MKNRLALIAAVVTMAANSNTFAQQNSRIVTTTTTEQHDPSYSLGRDFWFAPAQNYVDEPGKYIQVIITSTNNTTAYVVCNGDTNPVSVPSYGISTFNVPLAYEMKSSGNVENKAIHVYDNTDDIEVYLMSHNPYSADGMYCIPTIGWGTDYVVAGFASLFEGSYSSSNDFPSEFTISADQDNTIVDITPSCDLRMSNSYPENDSATSFPKGQKFSLTLNRGQSVQYQSVLPLNGDNYDVTGTVIHSSDPVGVVGASMCANIPQGFAYCNYVTDMIPPVRTWGETYYTTNSVHPVGEPNKNENLYLMISTVPNQTIYRYSPTEGLITEAVLDSTFDHLYAEEQGPNKFFSEQPFLLVEYLNSASYPDDVNGNGNPAEVVISPLEYHGGTILFATPPKAEYKYDNYANVIVNVSDVPNVLFDGKKITSYTHEPIDGNYEVFIIPHIEAAAIL